jgi:hypothetical protein
MTLLTVLGAPIILYSTESFLDKGEIKEWQGKVSANKKQNSQVLFSVKCNKPWILLNSQKYFKVKPEKVYYLTGYFKGNKNIKLFFGYRPLNKHKQTLWSGFLNPASKVTELLAPCDKNSKVLKVKNASNWKTGKNYLIVFEADPSGGFKDLPNYSVTDPGIERIENKGSYYLVHLSKSCYRYKKFAAGTKIRLHLATSSAIYNNCSNTELTEKWQRFQSKISGIALKSTPLDKWWPGTKFAQVLILFHSEGNDEVFFKNIQVTEEDAVNK